MHLIQSFKNKFCFDLPLFSKYPDTSINSYFYKITLFVYAGFFGQIACAFLFGFSIGSYDTSIVIIFKTLVNDITIPLGFSMFIVALASLGKLSFRIFQ